MKPVGSTPSQRLSGTAVARARRIGARPNAVDRLGLGAAPSSSDRSSPENQQLYSRTMKRLRVCIGVLSALLLASVAHAVTDGLSAGRVLALAVTTLLLLASLGLWRLGSRHKPGGGP
jgi:hypothetical protein